MKKIILLILILPLSLLMAIDFTMTKEGLFANTAVQSPTPGDTPSSSTDSGKTNPYLEPVNLPKCDANNPEVQFIKSNADWSKINYSSKRIFCVSPGDYKSLGSIKLTQSGTESKRRYIILNNGNDLHPGKLGVNDVAQYDLEFDNASYWTVDRMTCFDRASRNVEFKNVSTHNILNRMYQKNYLVAVWIYSGNHYNTIQNSRFDSMTLSSFANDLSTIQIVDYNHIHHVHGTKVINNEFINAKPGRLNRYTGQDCQFNGTVVDSNTVEYTKKVRTDCNGNLNENGECMAGESSGFSAKYGSVDPDNPVIFSNNKIWGGRIADPTLENLSGAAIGFILYVGAPNVHVLNNVIFDGEAGITLGDRYDKPHGTEHIEVTGNLIVDCGSRPHAPWTNSLTITQAYYANIHDNTIINPRGVGLKVKNNDEGCYVGNNTIVNPSNEMITSPNKYPVAGFDTNIEYATAAEGKYTEDYSFVTDKFTNNPRTITLHNVIKKGAVNNSVSI